MTGIRAQDGDARCWMLAVFRQPWRLWAPECPRLRSARGLRAKVGSGGCRVVAQNRRSSRVRFRVVLDPEPDPDRGGQARAFMHEVEALAGIPFKAERYERFNACSTVPVLHAWRTISVPAHACMKGCPTSVNVPSPFRHGMAGRCGTMTGIGRDTCWASIMKLSVQSQDARPSTSPTVMIDACDIWGARAPSDCSELSCA